MFLFQYVKPLAVHKATSKDDNNVAYCVSLENSCGNVCIQATSNKCSNKEIHTRHSVISSIVEVNGNLVWAPNEH